MMFALANISIAVIEHNDQKQLGKQMVYFTLQSEVHHPRKLRQKFKAETWRQRLEGKSWKNTVYWLSARQISQSAL